MQLHLEKYFWAGCEGWEERGQGLRAGESWIIQTTEQSDSENNDWTHNQGCLDLISFPDNDPIAALRGSWLVSNSILLRQVCSVRQAPC